MEKPKPKMVSHPASAEDALKEEEDATLRSEDGEAVKHLDKDAKHKKGSADADADADADAIRRSTITEHPHCPGKPEADAALAAASTEEETHIHSSSSSSISPIDVHNLMTSAIQDIPNLPPLLRAREAPENRVPGAYSVQWGSYNAPLRQIPGQLQAQPDVDSSCEQQPSTEVEDSTGSTAVRARPVDDEEAALPVAEQMNCQASTQERRNKDHIAATGLLVTSLTVIAIAVVVTALVSAGNKGHDQNSDTELAFIKNESAAEDVSNPEQVIKNLLPGVSLQAIQRSDQSPQSKALQWLLDDPNNATAYSPNRLLQRFALATFYFATAGDEWFVNDNWLDYTQHECQWFSQNQTGTFQILIAEQQSPCNQELEFNRLWLSENELRGTIPEELYYLTALTSLALDGNKELGGTLSTRLGQLELLESFRVTSLILEGTVPTEVGRLTKLNDLHLVYAGLTGTIPSEMGLLTDMVYFKLDSNRFTGQLPSELGLLSDSLLFYTAANAIAGTVPSEFGQLSSVEEFWIHDNLMTGTLPTELGLLTNLQYLWFYFNSMTGPIPSELGKLTNLIHLVGEYNDLDGTIPTELALLRNMTIMRVWNNSFTGAIPSELGLLSNLEWLALTENKLTGEIPIELWNMSNLKHLGLGNNRYTSSIPTEIVNLKSVEILSLRGLVTGQLPSELALLSNLWTLWLDDSPYAGTLPTEFGQMSSLGHLLMRNSSITGALPSELALLPNIKTLHFSRNNISGSIPQELAVLRANASNALESFNVTGNPLLTGTVPQNMCEMRGLIGEFCSRYPYFVHYRAYEECGVAFDCSEHLCGCDCACGSK